MNIISVNYKKLRQELQRNAKKGTNKFGCFKEI